MLNCINQHLLHHLNPPTDDRETRHVSSSLRRAFATRRERARRCPKMENRVDDWPNIYWLSIQKSVDYGKITGKLDLDGANSGFLQILPPIQWQKYIAGQSQPLSYEYNQLFWVIIKGSFVNESEQPYHND